MEMIEKIDQYLSNDLSKKMTEISSKIALSRRKTNRITMTFKKIQVVKKLEDMKVGVSRENHQLRKTRANGLFERFKKVSLFRQFRRSYSLMKKMLSLLNNQKKYLKQMKKLEMIGPDERCERR